MNAYWIAKLSDGTEFTQTGVDGDLSDWTRLKSKIKKENLSILDLILKNEETEISLFPPDQEGFFFSKKIFKVMHSENELHSYLLGIIKNRMVLIQEWQVPNLILINTETRALNVINEACIILNENK